MKKKFYTIFLFLFILHCLSVTSAQEQGNLIKDLFGLLNKKDEFTLKDAYKYFGYSYIEAENIIYYLKYGKILNYSPSDLNYPPNNREGKIRSEFLITLKEWLEINNFNLNKFDISVGEKNNYITNYYFKFKTKILIFQVALYENYNDIISIHMKSLSKENNVMYIITKMFNRDLYTIIASSTRTSEDNRYSVKNLNDNYYNTVWVAGGIKAGIGEYLIYKFKKKFYIEGMFIINGYAKSNYLFKANNRVKRLQIEFNNQKSIIQLNDVQKGQVIPIGDKIEEIKLTILDIYKGNKYPNDICIGELRPGLNEE